MNVEVTETFEIKAGMTGLKHAPGLIVVFDASKCNSTVPKSGSRIRVSPPRGGGFDLVVGEVKKHGIGRSFFFEGLERREVPVGSILSWSAAKKSKGQRLKAGSV